MQQNPSIGDFSFVEGEAITFLNHELGLKMVKELALIYKSLVDSLIYECEILDPVYTQLKNLRDENEEAVKKIRTMVQGLKSE